MFSNLQAISVPGWATFSRTRAVFRQPGSKGLFAAFAASYLLIASMVGGMLELGPTTSNLISLRLLTDASAASWWNYPALLVVSPGGVLVLPLLPTITMAISAIGVGVGMTAGLLLAFQVVRAWRQERRDGGRAAATSTLVGLTPAMVVVLTLGACCSTTAAAVAGIGVAATGLGASAAWLSSNGWYLDLVQPFVLGLALLAQEQLFTLFPSATESGRTSKLARPRGPRTLAPLRRISPLAHSSSNTHTPHG